MKKLLVSLGAILTALPMMANAAVTDADPGATSNNAAVANAAPKYALATSSSIDSAVATAGYVKGAYNAAIKGVNKVHEEVAAARSSFEDNMETLDETYATKTGVLATINSAETAGTFNSALQNGAFTGAELSDAAVAGSATASFAVVANWGDATTTNLNNITATLSDVTVSGTIGATVTGTVSGTTSGTITAPANYVTGA